MMPLTQQPNNACLELDLAGQVQGVGMRPMLFRLAQGLDLKGVIFNHSAGARAELDGPHAKLEQFCQEVLRYAKPPMHIKGLRKKFSQVRGFTELHVTQPPTADAKQCCENALSIPPDLATCPACWQDFFDVRHRLYHYPFISCTACGPRWSIFHRLPFERDHTTLESFPLCAICLHEYTDPRDRRFHAQTLTCPQCGPRLTLWTAGSAAPLADESCIENVRDLITNGKIGLIKGIGGFQLIGSALDPRVIARVRKLKSRPSQSIAIMFNSESAFVSAGGAPEDWKTLTSPVAPIVSLANVHLATRHQLAPDLRELGVMAPTTGLHYLIGEKMPPLIMTSGNRKGHPLPRSFAEISFSLGKEIDFVLDHNREIAHGLDDSVLRGNLILRKARGLAPQVWPRLVPNNGSTVVALGADMKNSAALANKNSIIELPYAGELGDPEGLERQKAEIQSALKMLGLAPAAPEATEATATNTTTIAIDIHPSSLTAYLSPDSHSSLRAVPHHLAHAYAASTSESPEKAADLVLTFDGTGFNQGFELKGGEAYRLVNQRFQPVISLRASPLVAGDSGVRTPWRSAVAMLACSGFALDALQKLFPELDSEVLKITAQLATNERFAVMCSSVGRWFDAAAAIIDFGIREIEYEAQAPIRLENLAAPFSHEESLPEDVVSRHSITEIDGKLLLTQLATWRLEERFTKPELSYLAHDQMARAWAGAINLASARNVLATGGVFQNQVFFECLKKHLDDLKISITRPTGLPVNDQSIALGQVAYLDSGAADA